MDDLGDSIIAIMVGGFCLLAIAYVVLYLVAIVAMVAAICFAIYWALKLLYELIAQAMAPHALRWSIRRTSRQIVGDVETATALMEGISLAKVRLPGSNDLTKRFGFDPSHNAGRR